MKNSDTNTIESFADLLVDILKSDRYILLVCSGETGEGKSCFTTQLAQRVAEKAGTGFNYKENMTYLRSELKEWIDKKPEYSVILADEFISLFFSRNWYDGAQIEGIELLNKCRDRHLCIIGNIPNFWQLDSGLYPLVKFWVHIPERGHAYVFQKSKNPFSKEAWFKKQNEQIWFSKRDPTLCRGFVTEVKFSDWSPEEKKVYYETRNTKRQNTELQKEGKDRWKDIRKQRNNLIWWAVQELGKQQQQVADVCGLDNTTIGYILNQEGK
jgi:hypothetical protein